jgi:hypothetical protein
MAGPELKLVLPPDKQQAKVESIHVGRRYSFPEGVAGGPAGTVLADTDVCVGAYRVTPGQAQVVALDKRGPVHVWNLDAASLNRDEIERLWGRAGRLVGNRLQIAAAALDGPFLVAGTDGLMLQLTAEFELDWHTEEQSAALGGVETVQSRRSVHFEDGGTQVLIDTAAIEGPVRYAHPGGGDNAINSICAFQQLGRQGRHLYRVPLKQAIPEQIGGRVVSDITVLEQYTSHFLQCEDPTAPERCIWVPLISPMTWGWSIRVARRTDGEWGILRRKLVMPTCQDEGMVLPVWKTDTAACSMVP